MHTAFKKKSQNEHWIKAEVDDNSFNGKSEAFAEPI